MQWHEDHLVREVAAVLAAWVAPKRRDQVVIVFV